MNKRGRMEIGFVFLIVFFVLMLAAFAIISPFKEFLDDSRGGDQLNCPGTPDFNQTAYDNQDGNEQLNRRPTCFVTGISMVWFISAFLIAGVVWVVKNWRGLAQ